MRRNCCPGHLRRLVDPYPDTWIPTPGLDESEKKERVTGRMEFFFLFLADGLCFKMPKISARSLIVIGWLQMKRMAPGCSGRSISPRRGVPGNIPGDWASKQVYISQCFSINPGTPLTVTAKHGLNFESSKIIGTVLPVAGLAFASRRQGCCAIRFRTTIPIKNTLFRHLLECK